MNYPIKIQETLTLACIDLHNARNLADAEAVLTMLEELDQLNQPIPEWLTAWLVLTMQNSLLTAEENFKRPKSSDFTGMGWVNNQVDREIIERKKLESAISAAGCNTHIAMRNAAFMIASRILTNASGSSDEFGAKLAYEWHCHTTETQLLSDPENFALLVQILKRELEFWQHGVKARAKVPLKLKPLALV